MPHDRRGGTMTFWRNWGAGTPGLLMIHCSLAHSGAWNGFVEHLDRPAIAFDLPGHGNSDGWNPSFDYLDQCLDVAADFLGQGSMDIVGHSFGAVVGLRLAMQYPGRVRHIAMMEPVILAAARGTREYDWHMSGFRPFTKAFVANDFRLAARIFTSIWGTGAKWEELREDQRQAMISRIHLIPAQDGAVLADNAAMLRPGRLEDLEVPALLLEGGKSPPVIAAVNDALAARLPKVTRHVIPNAGHMLPITNPAETAAAVGDFLSP